MESALSLRIFYPDRVEPGEIAAYNDAFAFWYEIWVETRREVDQTLVTPSDAFSRQSEILVLYSDHTPIASVCHRYVDLRHASVLHDSFFTPSIWPASVMAKVPGLGHSCLLGAHIYIHHDFRKRQTALPVKHIICALSMAHVNGTRPDVMIGMPRIDRGVHTLFYDCGAISLREDVSWYHIPIDLIAFFPRRMPIPTDPRYQEAVTTIGRTCDRFARDYFARPRVSESDRWLTNAAM